MSDQREVMEDRVSFLQQVVDQEQDNDQTEDHQGVVRGGKSLTCFKKPGEHRF